MSSIPAHLLIALELDALRYEPTLENLHAVIEQEIAASATRIEDASSRVDTWFLEAEIDDECDHVEELLGLAFVAAQSFVTKVKSSITRMSEISVKEIGKRLSFATRHEDILKKADPMKNAPQYSEIEVINAVANYWKHREQWSTIIEQNDEYGKRVWDVSNKQNNVKRTIEIVMSIGMSPGSTGNLRTAYEAFCPDRSYQDLSPIRAKLRSWVQSLHEIAKVQMTDLASRNTAKGDEEEPSNADSSRP